MAGPGHGALPPDQRARAGGRRHCARSLGQDLERARAAALPAPVDQVRADEGHDAVDAILTESRA